MTEQEKKAALAQKERLLAQQLEQAAEALRRQFDACPVEGKACRYTAEERMLPMPDGVRLHTLLYRPEGAARFPVLVQRSCYPNQIGLYRIYGEELARRGYGYMLQFCRGAGKSEGSWEPNVNERRDGLETLRWLDVQPWAESIGYFGASYLALTGWAVADALPPKVKGMMLTVYGTDRFKSAYEKGLFRHDVLTGWAMDNAGRPVEADYLESCRYRPHAAVDAALWGGRLDWYQDWIHADRRSDPYWQQGWWKQLADIPARVDVPVYIVEAWYDHHFGSAMNTYQALSARTRAHSWLDIGCWDHMSRPCVDWPGQTRLENGDVRRVLEWFELLLRKKQTPAARVRAYIMREDVWRTLENWPVPADEMRRLYLGEGGRLRGTAPAEGSCSFLYDPADPCPTCGAESVLTTIEQAGSRLQPPPDHRPDVRSFLSEPLREPLPICGAVKVRLRAATDGSDTAFTAKLSEVFPDGNAYNIRGGVTTIAADLPEGAAYTPGTAAEVCIDLWDMAWVVQPGSRLRLDISSSDFPQYAVHSNYPGVWSEQAQVRAARQTLCLGEGSRIEQPLKRGL